MARYVVGDIHGRLGALKEVLTSSEFDYKEDKLIVLGDVVDGGPDAKGVVDELLKINNLVFVLGNHDKWFIDFMRYGVKEDIWTRQGGNATLRSYRREQDGCVYIPVTHQHFFNKHKKYHIEDDMIFVHGGFNPDIPIEDNSRSYCTWDRELIDYAKGHAVRGYSRVFVGHSTTLVYGTTEPQHFNNLWMLDTGAGHLGKLTLMDIDTEEYWQSKRQPSCK